MFEPWERDLLDASRTGHFATAGLSGWPHVVPVCFALFGDEAAIAIDEKPKSSAWPQRLRNIEREPRCTLLVDHWSEDWSGLAWVRVEAEGRIEARGEHRRDLLAALRARYPQYRAMDLESRPLIVLAPVRVVSWRARA